MGLVEVSQLDADRLRAFLGEVDLTTSGLSEPTVRLWIVEDAAGNIVGSTGFELSGDRRHALIRSVGVSPQLRSAGQGSALARYALGQAAQCGATTAWLFSRRSGPFWQKLGFVPADRHELADALRATHQVRLFQQSGQIEHEVAWSRSLAGAGAA